MCKESAAKSGSEARPLRFPSPQPGLKYPFKPRSRRTVRGPCMRGVSRRRSPCGGKREGPRRATHRVRPEPSVEFSEGFRPFPPSLPGAPWHHHPLYETTFFFQFEVVGRPVGRPSPPLLGLLFTSSSAAKKVHHPLRVGAHQLPRVSSIAAGSCVPTLAPDYPPHARSLDVRRRGRPTRGRVAVLHSWGPRATGSRALDLITPPPPAVGRSSQGRGEVPRVRRQGLGFWGEKQT